jgi:pilus assembly protein Flp/PilA
MLHAAFARFRREEAGATAIEYGLIAALIAVALLGTMSILGVSVQDLYAGGTSSAAGAINAAVAGAN